MEIYSKVAREPVYSVWISCYNITHCDIIWLTWKEPADAPLTMQSISWELQAGMKTPFTSLDVQEADAAWKSIELSGKRTITPFHRSPSHGFVLTGIIYCSRGIERLPGPCYYHGPALGGV